MSILPAVTTKRQISRYSASTRELVNYNPERPQQLGGQRRWISDHSHFYRNRQLELYAAKEARRLTLRQLVRSPFHNLLSPPPLPAQSPNIKRNFLGLVWPLYDRRTADHSERRFQHYTCLLCCCNDFLHLHPTKRARIMFGRSCRFGFHIDCETCKHYRTSS